MGQATFPNRRIQWLLCRSSAGPIQNPKTETERCSMEASYPLNPGDVDDLIYGDLDYEVSQR